MAKTLNDIIEDFDSQLKEKAQNHTEEEVTKSVEETEKPETVEEGAEVEPKEQLNESEEVAENDGEESGVVEAVEGESEEAETETVEVEDTVEETEIVEKSKKEKEEEEEEEEHEEHEHEENKKKEKEQKDKVKEEEKEDKEKLEKSNEVETEQVFKSSELLGAMEAIFKNMLGLTEKLDEIHREFKEAKEAKEKEEAEAVEKSLVKDAEIKTGIEDVEGKAVGFLSKSVTVEEEPPAVEEPAVDVVVDGEEVQEEKEPTFREQVQSIRTDFMETYKRVSVSGVAQRGELESVRHTWGTARTADDLDKIKGFIEKYK